MDQDRRSYDEDDGRVVADMSEVSRTPLLIPRFDEVRRRRDIGPSEDQPSSPPSYQSSVNLDREERRAMIGGAISAGLLVVGCMAVRFAALILFILHVLG